jgi:predicted Na+-dependent transporter
MVTEFETKLLGVMMMVIMMGMGASLTWRDFLIAFRKPKGHSWVFPWLCFWTCHPRWRSA